MLAYSGDAPSRRPEGAKDVPSATEAKQEEAAAHTKGKEDDQAAEEARDRRRALHQALTSGRYLGVFPIRRAASARLAPIFSPTRMHRRIAGFEDGIRLVVTRIDFIRR